MGIGHSSNTDIFMSSPVHPIFATVLSQGQSSSQNVLGVFYEKYSLKKKVVIRNKTSARKSELVLYRDSNILNIIEGTAFL